jgi:hypothetical protein
MGLSRSCFAACASTARVPLATLALALSLLTSGAGCNDKACIQWSESVQGACPGPETALEYMTLPPPPFGGQTCQEVLSVDGEGDYNEDDGICCYDVTLSDQGGDDYCCNGACG